ncbi:MAG: hypothetical protein KJZ91_15265 [Myxococcales bacterium]|nr:hypothetical protein [Myxococcales bacterium]
MSDARPAVTWSRRLARPVVTLAVFALLVVGLRRLLGTFEPDEVVAGLAATPVAAMVAALGLLAAQYAMYVARELLAVRFAGCGALAAVRVVLAALVSRSLGTLGLATITGLALRLRLYAAWGLDHHQVARLTLYNEATHYVGLLASAAIVLLTFELPPLVALDATLPVPRLFGALAAALVAAYVALALGRERPWRIRSFELPALSGRLLVPQLVLPLADTVVASAIVWVLLPPSAGLDYPATVTACLLAGVLGSLSQLPGGVGVFEAAVLQFVPPSAHAAALAGLLVRRVVVSLVPVAIGTLLLVGYELVRRAPVPPRSWPRETAATAMAATSFAVGVLLMMLPSFGLGGSLLSLGQVAHALVFADGFATLLVARGLHLRRARSWRYALALFSARALIALAAGPDLVAIGLCLAMIALLAASRRAFSDQPAGRDDDAAWIAAFAIAVAGAGWLALSAEPGGPAVAAAARGGGVLMVLALIGGDAAERWWRRRRHRRASLPPPLTSPPVPLPPPGEPGPGGAAPGGAGPGSPPGGAGPGSPPGGSPPDGSPPAR